MRVDLCLQRPELRFAEVDLLSAHGRHQLLDFPHQMGKRRRQILHLAHAGDRLVDKVICVFLERLHRGNQVMNGAGEDSGKQHAHRQRCCHNRNRRRAEQLGNLAQAVGDDILHKAHAYHAPVAARQRLDGVDHGADHVAAVVERGNECGVLLLEIGIDQLLLRMVDDISLHVLQEAVAALPDADAVDIGGNVAAADIDCHPLFPFACIHRADDRHDPRIVALEQRHNVRRGDIALLIDIQHCPVERQVFQNDRAHLMIQAVAAHQMPRLVVNGHGDDIGADFQKGIEKMLPVLRRRDQLGSENLHDVVHVSEVAVDRACHLRNGAPAVGLRVADQRLLIRPQKERNRAPENPDHDRRQRQNHDLVHAEASLFHARAPFCSRSCRILAGETP